MATWAELRRQGEQLARAMLQLAEEDPGFVRAFDRGGGMTCAEVLEIIARMNAYASTKVHAPEPE
jgi:hypothetical protein